MFNIILALTAGILIGWNFHTFFLALETPKVFKHDINISQEHILLKPEIPLPHKPNEMNLSTTSFLAIKKTKEKEPSSVSFYSLLHDDLFSDALALYLDADTKKLPLYRTTLMNYFKENNLHNPKETILKMQEFLEIEPDNRTIKLELVATYRSIQKYNLAVNLLTELLDSASNTESDLLQNKLLLISNEYVDTLKKAQNFQQLIGFLEARIEYGFNIPFYSYILAETYVELEKYQPAVELLKEIEFSDEYGEKAKILLSEIEKLQTEEQKYPHKLPLTKKGSHFLIDVSIDNTDLRLLLDTGATYTLINEEKLSNLTLINDHLVLNTAGGEIIAKMQEAETFTVGEIELEKFQVTTSSFYQESADGLLGMNFFNKFDFKINQNTNTLYLSEKKDENQTQG